MNKKQVNEMQLLADATRWFKQKYGKFPIDCGLEFIKVWYKPTPFVKTPAVVFAPTEEIGKAFIWEQNVIFRSMGNFWLIGVFFIIFTITFFRALSQGDNTTAHTIATTFTALSMGALIFFIYLTRKCKKCEKIHQWNVEVYYSRK